ncbi:MAG TPA: hypothetical protein VFA10_24820 [Ktedonobacteraceae bacterium]|jgi:hypothetical protein|nr:hypothetical protein [Ktedonobacteraceae bacterium]
MRGKLRDKRTEASRDVFKRDVFERRRMNKRDNRSPAWQLQELEDENLLDGDENQVAQVDASKQQTPKKK